MDSPTERNFPKYVCINCEWPADELYRRYQGGTLKISHCEKCGNIVDRYIEYDPVLIFLDVLLHKPHTYRHILFNATLQWYWKLLIILLLCDTYIKWESTLDSTVTQSTSDTIFYAALEWRFYVMLLFATLEWSLCFGTFYMYSAWSSSKDDSSLGKTFKKSHYNFESLLKTLTVASFGKAFLIPAIVWGQSQSIVWLQLTHFLVYTSNVSAFKVYYSIPRRKAMLLVACAQIPRIAIAGNLLSTFQYFL